MKIEFVIFIITITCSCFGLSFAVDGNVNANTQKATAEPIRINFQNIPTKKITTTDIIIICKTLGVKPNDAKLSNSSIINVSQGIPRIL